MIQYNKRIASLRFLILLYILSLMAFAPACAAPGCARSQAVSKGEANLLEIGSASKIQAPALEMAEVKIVSYNIRWRGGDDLRRLINLLRDDQEIGRATIIGLQEVDRNRQRTGNVNTARKMAEELGMHYAWAAPPTVEEGQEEETGVAILSPYPLRDVVRIVLPHEGPGRRRRAAVGATISIGTTDVRVYSVHAETRIKMEKKMEQLRATLDDLQRHPKIERAVVLGDFNTIKGKDVKGSRKLFTEAGFTTPIPDDRSTFKAVYILKLKLDWIWLRGLRTTGSGIVRRIGLSDHWPLWVTVKLKDSDKLAPSGN
jgi:endonuclease/exonuclease/phosphatase family metal-dependent hydrolase